MDVSKGDQGIAEGGRLAVIKRTWEMQNNVGPPAVLDLGLRLEEQLRKRAALPRSTGHSGGEAPPPPPLPSAPRAPGSAALP